MHASPLFNFGTKQGPTVSVPNIKDIALYGCSEIYKPEISRFLLCMLQFLDNLRWLFIFFKDIGEIDHSTLDLVLNTGPTEKFLIVDHLRKITINESLNVRL